MEVNDFLTQEQINAIRGIIIHQCRRHRERDQNYQDLYYAPYAGNRGEHSITTSILSGFRETTLIPGFTITILQYGANEKMGQPVLTSDNAILHIYNSGCGFSSKPFKECCETYNDNLDNYPVFACIVFTASNDGSLKKVQIRVPDADGKFIHSYVIFDYTSNNAEIA